MRIHTVIIAVAIGALLTSCGSPPPAPPAESAKPAATVKPPDESRRFSSAHLVSTEVIGQQLLGKSFMPGGTLAHYKNGKTDYTEFIAKLPTAQDAAFLLPDWRKELAGAKLVPSFGGYFGQDAGRPVFVFAKNAWIAGVAGLPEKDADLAARALAAHLD